MLYSAKDEKQLMTELWDPAIADDPYAFVMFAFPWKKAGTPLANVEGPKAWQRDELQAVAEHIKHQKERMAMGLLPEVYQSAKCSGRGPGKSALMSMLACWLESCHIGATTIVTANTEPQLRLKTFAEIGKWHTLLINAHWFEKQAMSLKPAPWFEALVKSLKIDTSYYYCAGQTWSEENTDAYAGAHNPLGMMVEFDEASGIHEKIWDVTEGFFTDVSLYRFWFAFSNGRRNTGRFFNIFSDEKYQKYWKTQQIDARRVEGLDQAVYEKIIDLNGEDSDEAKVEVRGMFPNQGERQFISRELVEGAQLRETIDDKYAPLIMGVDPARFGSDQAVIRFRQGRNGRVIPPVKFKGLDNMQLADQCAFLIHKYNPDAVCIDAGNGTGVIDRLRQLKFTVTEVWFGAAADEKKSWANKRIELWAKMREWLKGGCIDADKELKEGMVSPDYAFVGRSDQQILESKEKMKQRGLPSPDDADALAVTFAVNPARRDMHTSRHSRQGRVAKDVDYDVYG